MNHEFEVIHLNGFNVKEMFTELSMSLPQNSQSYTLYLYHLRQLALILARESGGDEYTSVLRLLTKIGAELPLS